MTGGAWTAALDAFEAALERLEQGEDVPLARPPLGTPSPAERLRAVVLLERAAACEARMAVEIAEVAAELAGLDTRRAAARSYLQP